MVILSQANLIIWGRAMLLKINFIFKVILIISKTLGKIDVFLLNLTGVKLYLLETEGFS